MKYKNIIMIDEKGEKNITLSELPEEERRAIAHKMNVAFMQKNGFVPDVTEETA